MRSGKLLLLVVGLWSCDSVADPSVYEHEAGSTRDESELQFVRFPAALAPLAETSGAVWAVKGQNRVVSLRYRTSSGPGSDEFMRFEIPANALLRRPTSELFQPGDSVRISVQLGTDRRLLFHFEPSGLQFNPNDPARLRIDYRRLDGDLNGDGRVDDADTRLEVLTRIWCQEQPGGSWYPMETTKDDAADEVRTPVKSFTGFVIAA